MAVSWSGRSATFCGHPVGALGVGSGVGESPALAEVLAHVQEHPAEPAMVAGGGGQALGVLQMLEDPVELPERVQGRAQVEANVDGLRDHLGRLRQVAERLERLPEPPRRLPMRRAPVRLVPGLARVRHGLLPHAAPEGVVSEALDLLDEAAGVQPLDGPGDPAVEHAPAVLEEAAVRDLVRQRVAEGVLEVGEQVRLVQELGGPQMLEPLAQLLVALAGDLLEEHEAARPSR